LKLRELSYPGDENLDPDVVTHLRSIAWDVVTGSEAGLCGATDALVLRTAFAMKRAVLTHDGDFGRLAFAEGVPCIGVVYLRPGHIRAAFTISILDAVPRHDPDVQPPFILVAERRAQDVSIRLRHLTSHDRPQA
jgi:predicted nuclease of predicted toxin-antitoxin system